MSSLSLLTGAGSTLDAGDYNRDRMSDTLWRRDDGTVVSWDMNDAQILARHLLNLVPNTWHLQSDPFGSSEGNERRHKRSAIGRHAPLTEDRSPRIVIPGNARTKG